MFTENIGAIALTENQRLNWVKTGIWDRISYINGEVIGVSETQPQQSDIDLLISVVGALPDTVPQSVAENGFSSAKFKSALWLRFAQGQFSFSMRNEQANLSDLSNARNFAGMKSYLAMLQAQGVATSQDVANVKAAVLEQGVNLENY